jgi:Ca2+-binding RTX toxin-like protein
MKRFFTRLLGTNPRRLPARRRRSTLTVEALEDRRLASVTPVLLADGTLQITGSNAADTIVVRQYDKGLCIDGWTGFFSPAKVSRIRVDARGGNDSIDLSSYGPGYPGSRPITLPVEVHGGDGNDTIRGGHGKNYIFGEGGDDTLYAFEGVNYLDGGAGNDVLYGGTAGTNKLCGDAGNDVLYGGASGSNLLFGGDGADWLYGGPGGANTLDGGRDYDSLYPGRGSNTLYDDPGGCYVQPTVGQLSFVIPGHVDWVDMNLADAGARTLVRYLADDGSISRTDMMAVLDQIKQQGVSYAEFEGLKCLVYNDGAYRTNAPAMPEAVRNLAGKLIANPANAQIWYYEPVSIRFQHPQLHAGSSSAELDALENMWFRGAYHPTATLEGDSTPFAYQVAAGTLFGGPGHDLVDYDIIRQGEVGDCYFLSALGVVALRSNGADVRNLFTDNGDGTYTVRFFHAGKAEYVTVDRALPVDADGRLVFANKGALASDPNNALWAALAEKAYAQVDAEGWIGQDNVFTYQGIAYGYDTDALTQLTNHAAVYKQLGQNADGGAAMMQDWQNGSPMCLSSHGGTDLTAANIVRGHVYMVVNAVRFQNSTGSTYYFEICNPYGDKDPTKPHYVWLSYSELMASFYSWSVGTI